MDYPWGKWKSVTLVVGLALALGISSCATHTTQYRTYPTPSGDSLSIPKEDPIHSVFFVGGLGETRTTDGLALLAQHLEKAPQESTLVLLGNTIAPNRNPLFRGRESDSLRLKVDALLAWLGDYPGQTILIPGPLEWKENDLQGVQAIATELETRPEERLRFFPSPGCGGPDNIELAPGLELLLLDSQWWLENWSGQTGINEGCFIGNREVLAENLQEKLKDKNNGLTLVAMHHSLFSEGRHGGFYAPLDHLFPFRQLKPNLWIPLPGLGSLPPFYRFTVGTLQDIAHPKFKEYKKGVLTAARQAGNFVFLSAHEQVMHYLERSDQQFLIAGSGSAAQATRMGKGGLFASGTVGFGLIKYYPSGSAWVEFWGLSSEEKSGKLLYSAQIKPPIDQYVEPDTLTERIAGDSILVPISAKNYTREGFSKILWGEHYRAVYEQKLKVPLLHLSSFRGGVESIKASSGYITQNLELLTKTGLAYELRSLEKEADRIIPYPFKNSLAVELIEDNFSALHPLATLPLTPLQNAAGIIHTGSSLFYLPEQKALGRYNGSYANALYLLEENSQRAKFKSINPFGASAYLGSFDMFEQLISNPDHRVEEGAFIRTRLFDLLIGDWDRGTDHWSWAAYPSSNKVEYWPIARERELAFARYDGMILGVARLLSPLAKQLRKYDSQWGKNVRWLTHNGRFLDRALINQSSWPVWETQAKQLRLRLPDSIVYHAFQSSWPESIFQLDGERIIQTFNARKAQLDELARKFYLHLAKQVNVLGTRGRDWFIIERTADRTLKVSAFSALPNGEKGELRYDREFLPSETNAVTLYGLNGNDRFLVTGQKSPRIKVRMVGGLGKDQLVDSTSGNAWIKSNIFYDSKKENNDASRGPNTSTRLSGNPFLNSFNPEALDQDYPLFQVFPKIAINPDDGLVLGIGAQLTTYGFKARPFQTRQNIGFQWGTLTNGFAIDYTGEISNVIGPLSFFTSFRYQTPLYTINFYGFSNESVNPEDELGRNFNRVRQNLFNVFPALKLNLRNDAFLVFGGKFEQIRIEQVQGRIFFDSIPEGVDSSVFNWQRFIGPHLEFRFANLNDPAYPSRGIVSQFALGTTFRLTDRAQVVPYVRSSITSYLGLNRRESLVLAGRFGFKHLFTDDFLFYQASTIGGTGPDRTTRGFRRDRFSGRTAVYTNGELRWRFLESQNRIFPFSFGAYAGLDLGRVWVDGESSRRWHYGYGGGIFFSPLDLFTGVLDIYYGDRERLTIFADLKFYF